VGGVRGIRRAEGVARLPSLRGQYAVTEARRVIRPVGILRIIGDLGATEGA
jgi:hypothetical protein